MAEVRTTMLKEQYRRLQMVREVITVMDEEKLETKKDLIQYRQEIKELIRKLKNLE